MGDKPTNISTGQPLSEFELRERKVVETLERNAETHEKVAQTSVQQVEVMQGMTQQIAAMVAMQRVQLANSLLGSWSNGRPGRVSRATIQDALATVDDLLALANGEPFKDS